MHPILFEFKGITIYSYGFLIAIGAIAGIWYMAVHGKREVGLTFDQANTLFLLIFLAAFVGGKVFLFFEEPSTYIANPGMLLTGRGFVFYGSFLFAVLVMILFFRKHRLHPYRMLDVMAVTTCLVHMFGRLGCFMAGCCYGRPTASWTGVTFSDPSCYADPKNVPLHPTQLYEAIYILLVLVVLLYLRNKRTFYGQLFLTYLILYAIGRSVLEFFRGDETRGYILKNFISHSQFVAIIILVVVGFIYVRLAKQNSISTDK
jgi:phosphatidylglycerol:prolipoprotein diacylglycerol transferase